MATNNFNGGILPANFTPSINSYFGLIEKITEQSFENATARNPLGFLDKGNWKNGTTLEQNIIEMASAYDFDATAVDVFATTNPSVVSQMFKDWTSKQFATTVSTSDIRKILNNEESVENVVEKTIVSLTEGEIQEDYDTLKALLLFAKNTATNPIAQATGTVSDGATMLKAIKNAISTMKFSNTTYNALGVKSKTRAEDIVVLIPSTQQNALDVDTLAYVKQLEKDGIIAEIHEIDTTDGLIYVFDRNAFGYRTRLRELTDQPNKKALKINYWLTTDKLYYYSPLFKACYIDASAVV